MSEIFHSGTLNKKQWQKMQRPMNIHETYRGTSINTKQLSKFTYIRTCTLDMAYSDIKSN